MILGPISHLDYPPVEKGGINVSGTFRVKLDLYANVRPARSRAGLGRPMDLVIMRECTEGFYPDRNMFRGSGEFMPVPGVALSVRQDHRARVRAHRATGLRARPQEKEAGDCGAQGERVPRHRRPISRPCTRWRASFPT